MQVGEVINARSSSSSVREYSVPETTTTKTTPLPDLTPLQTIGPICIDDELARDLWQNSQAANPGVTIDELRACMHAHVSLATYSTVKNPRKFLCVTVVNALHGPWLQCYRAAVAEYNNELQESKRRIESEETAWSKYENGEGPNPWTGRMKPTEGNAP
jgi:hypothetical protein